MNSSFPIPHLTFPSLFLIPHDIPVLRLIQRNNFQKDFLPALLSNGYPNKRYCQCCLTDRSLPFQDSHGLHADPYLYHQHSLLCLQQYLIQIKRQNVQHSCYCTCLPVIEYQFMVFLYCYRLQNYHNLSY